jgi:L-asparaginase II
MTMTQPALIAEIWRGDFLESTHLGHVAVADAGGGLVAAWGDPDMVILPRSAVKPIQALPLIDSGAAAAFGLKKWHLALACASHQGADTHVERVTRWLRRIDRTEDDLRCGPQPPRDRDLRHALIRERMAPGQIHNNCSGKHTGFLTLERHVGGGPEYLDIDHPVQRAVREAFEEMTGATSPGWAIDGCSAPNFACSLSGLAGAMARFAVARKGAADRREAAAARLVAAMMRHPDLVAGDGRACTELMHAAPGRVAAKTGAEGVFVAILPEAGLGIAVKAADGATRAAEAAIAALLVRFGVLDAADPAALRRMAGPIRNWRGVETGTIRSAQALSVWRG